MILWRPKPRATGLSLDETVADHLEYLHHEAFYVVSTAFEVTATGRCGSVCGTTRRRSMRPFVSGTNTSTVRSNPLSGQLNYRLAEYALGRATANVVH